MTTLQRLRIKSIKQRARLNEIANLEGDAMTTEIRSEADTLTTEYATNETQLAAAEAAEPDPETRATVTEDSEVRERRTIRRRTGLRDYLRAATIGGPVQGAAAEFNAACGVIEGDRMPLELFDAPARELRQARELSEHRAVTPGPAIDAPVMPTIPYLFEASVLSTLAVSFPSVMSGVQQIPAITTAPPADAVQEDGAAPSTAAAYTLSSRSPKRIAGAIQFSVEDLAVAPQLESDLTESLQGSLSNELDEEGFNGNNAGGSLNGLFQQAANVAADGTTDTFALGLAAFAALVDGRFSRGMQDLRAVVGSATHAKYMGLYHGGSGDVTLFEKLRSLMGSLVVSDRMPAVSGGAQKGIVTRNAAGQMIRIYTWNALQMIRDPYTAAGTGKVSVTAFALVSDPFIPHGVNQALEVHRDLS